MLTATIQSTAKQHDMTTIDVASQGTKWIPRLRDIRGVVADRQRQWSTAHSMAFIGLRRRHRSGSRFATGAIPGLSVNSSADHSCHPIWPPGDSPKANQLKQEKLTVVSSLRRPPPLTELCVCNLQQWRVRSQATIQHMMRFITDSGVHLRGERDGAKRRRRPGSVTDWQSGRR
jgi:hypothetical protein